MGFAKVLLLSALSVTLLAYLTRPKWPESASNPQLKTVVGLVIDVFDILSYAGGLIGFSPINVTRTLYGLQLKLNKPAADVQEYITHMDGVEVTVFKPVGDTDQLRPGIIHIHGGGWVVMTPAHYAPYIQELVRQTQSVVVSINYRLAPEHIFPVPFEDCLKASHFFLKNAEKYGADGTRIAIKGDSAGGNLALAVALNLATDVTRPANELKLLSVDYGALQAFDLNLPSLQTHEYGPGLLNKKRMTWYWVTYAFGHQDYYDMFYSNDHITKELKASFYKDRVSADYLPKEILKEFKDTSYSASSRLKDSEVTNAIKDIITNPMFSPLLAPDEDLAKLPTTYVMNVEFDVLRDDNFILSERLKNVGVKVKHTYLPSEEHGFINHVEVDGARKEIVNFAKFFNKTV